MNDFYFDNLTKFLVGDKAIHNLPYEISRLGCRRVLLVCDESAYRLGNSDMIKSAFDSHDVQIEYVYNKVDSIATNLHCENIARYFKSKNCDCIIAVGKKGAISAAKGAKVLIMDGSNYISKFEKKSLSPYSVTNPPLIVIPTNLGSGVECSNFIRIYDEDHNKVFEIDSNFASSNIVVVDSLMTDTMPPKAIATYGLFALSMAVETYVNDNTILIAKAYADVSIKLVFKYLKKCMLRNANIKYRTKLMEAVVLAGAAFSNNKRGELCVISDAISDRYKVNYANVFVILFRHYIKNQELGTTFGYCLNAMMDMDEYALFAKQSRSQKALSKIEEMYSMIGEYVDFNEKLSDFNIPEEELELIVDEVSNVIDCEKEKILELLKVAY